jgi:hypothetical protein
MMVAVGGIDVTVGSGIAVSVGETTVTAGVHEVKTRAMSKTVLIFLTFINTFFCKELANCPSHSTAMPGFLSDLNTKISNIIAPIATRI